MTCIFAVNIMGHDIDTKTTVTQTVSRPSDRPEALKLLILSNDDVREVLTMEMAIDALKQSYREVAEGEGISRPRIDLRFPTKDPSRIYQWGTMEGGSVNTGYFATRMKSDIRFQADYGGVETHEKYSTRPGLFMGLILLVDINNGEPLAFINDSVIQRMRVGADSAIGAELMARTNARVVGMLGSGGMARSHIRGFCAVRPIDKIQVYSPTREHREQFAREVAQELEIETVVCDNPADVYRGADILAVCTDGGFKENPGSIPSAHLGRYLEPGTHITSIWGALDADSIQRIDRALVLGTSPPPVGYPDLKVSGLLTWAVPPETPKFRDHHYHRKMVEEGIKVVNTYPVEEKTVYMEELLADDSKGRTSPEQITFSERGNLQGAQFHAVGGKVYEAAKARGLGRELPTEWFLETERN